LVCNLAAAPWSTSVATGLDDRSAARWGFLEEPSSGEPSADDENERGQVELLRSVISGRAPGRTPVMTRERGEPPRTVTLEARPVGRATLRRVPAAWSVTSPAAVWRLSVASKTGRIRPQTRSNRLPTLRARPPTIARGPRAR